MRLQRSQLGALAIAGADVLQLATDQREVQLGDLVALHEHRARLTRVTGLQRRQPLGLGGHELLLHGHVGRRRRVLARDRLQVVDALDQVGEPVRLQDDGGDVRRRRLVGGDDLGHQHLAVARELNLQRAQAGARRAQLRAQARQHAALDAEARFQRAQPRLQVVDAALEPLDLVGVGADARAQLTFPRLRCGDAAFQASRRRATDRRSANGRRGGEGGGGHQDGAREGKMAP